MENLQMIKVDENGQMYIDFDILEDITSYRFVDRLKTISNEETIVKFRVNVLKNSVKVYLLTDYGRFYIYDFYRDSKNFDEKKIFDTDVRDLFDMLKNF